MKKSKNGINNETRKYSSGKSVSILLRCTYLPTFR
jgi:hypothetical protein